MISNHNLLDDHFNNNIDRNKQIVRKINDYSIQNDDNKIWNFYFLAGWSNHQTDKIFEISLAALLIK